MAAKMVLLKYKIEISWIICSFSFSSISYGISEEFLRIIANTTLEQEQTFEAEKKIIEAMQDRKVDESDYKPIVEGEFTGSLIEGNANAYSSDVLSPASQTESAIDK